MKCQYVSLSVGKPPLTKPRPKKIMTTFVAWIIEEIAVWNATRKMVADQKAVENYLVGKPLCYADVAPVPISINN